MPIEAAVAGQYLQRSADLSLQTLLIEQSDLAVAASIIAGPGMRKSSANDLIRAASKLKPTTGGPPGPDRAFYLTVQAGGSILSDRAGAEGAATGRGTASVFTSHALLSVPHPRLL